MSKVLLFSDLHVHAHRGKQERLQNCLDCLRWIFQSARDRGIKDVIFGGDLFQDRQRISVYTYHQTYKIFQQFHDLNIWLLLGNHDLWYYEKTDISSVAPIGGLSHVTVIDKPGTIRIAGVDFDFLPFTHDPVSAIRENFVVKSPVLIGHIAVDGAVLNFHYNTKAEVSVELDNDMVAIGTEMFDGYRRVFLGHYHGAQKLNDVVEYIGSALQLTFNEAFQEKHVIILDVDDLSVEYLENIFSPKHFILAPDELSSYDLNNNFVRIRVDDLTKTDMFEVKLKIIERYPGAQVTFVHDGKKEDQQDEKIEKFNLMEGDILERYVRSVGHGDLKLSQLLNLGKEICVEI